MARVPELQQLEWAVDRAVDGAGSTVVLTGEPGIGKSRAAAELAAIARERGVAVLSGRAVRATTPQPLRPLSEALLAWLRREELPIDEDLQVFRPALGRLAPQLGDPRGGEQATSLVLLGEGLLRLAAAIGRDHGALLLVEDLHWADHETLAVLEYLADNLVDLPVALVVTIRPHEGAAAQELVHALAARGAADVVALGTLDDDGVAAMVSACLGAEPPPEVTRFVRDNAGGLPLLVEELLTGLQGAGTLEPDEGGWRVTGPISTAAPDTFARTVEQRLLAQPADVQRVAQAATLLGPGFDAAVLPRALGYADGTVFGALRALVQQQILVSGPEGIDFRHAMTREVVRATMLPPEAAELAGRLAKALDEAAEPQLVAELHELAGEPELAAQLWLDGARGATERGALATAFDMLERGATLAEAGSEVDLQLREQAVEVRSLAGDNAETLRIGADLLERLEERGADPARLARVRLRMARAAWSGGDPDRAETLLDGCTAADPAEVALMRAGIELGRQRHVEALQWAEQALADAGEGRPEIVCEAQEVIGRAERGRNILRSESAYEAGFRIAEQHGLAHWRSRLLTELAGLDAARRRPTEERLHAARAAGVETGALSTVAQVDWHLFVVRMRYHRLEEAQQVIESCLDQLRRLRSPFLGPAHVMLALAHGLAGRDEEMEREMAAARAVDPDDVVVAAGEWGHLRGPVALARGRYDEARAHFGRAMARYREQPGLLFSLRGTWALLETVLGTPEEGAAARDEVRDGEQATSPVNWLGLRFADAVAAGRAGDRATAEEVFADADWAMPGPEPWLEHHLRALVAGCAAADGWGDPALWFRRALEGMVEVGQTEAASATRAAMRAAGLPVPRRTPGADRVPPALQRLGVTAREHDVLELVVQGLTNQAIAERLFLSPRTVEVHVARLLQRLGASARTELAGRVDELRG